MFTMTLSVRCSATYGWPLSDLRIGKSESVSIYNEASFDLLANAVHQIHRTFNLQGGAHRQSCGSHRCTIDWFIPEVWTRTHKAPLRFFR
jgi:hypothetical protein